MHVHKKAAGWINDVGAMVRGGIAAQVYRIPPKHYLDYTVDGKVPVIIIPGVLSPWGSMKKLADHLSLLGHPVYIVPELKSNLYAVPKSAKIVRSVIVKVIPKSGHFVPHVHRQAEHVRKFIEERNIKGAVIVAHSKGGLIGKYLLMHYNTDHRVLGMVAIATPFSGSKLAKLIPHDSYRELLADSKIVQDLEESTEVNHQIISLYPEYDTQIWSPKGSYLEGAENIEIPVQGHHHVLFSRRGQKAVTDAIERMTQRNPVSPLQPSTHHSTQTHDSLVRV